LRSLWSQWPKIRELLAGKNAILLLDFDGTLAPIVAHPSRARLPAPSRTALARLARSPRLALGIVSGRELSQLKRLVRLKNICYVGSHGLEWALPGLGPRRQASSRWSRPLARITKELRRALRGLPNVWIERKIASVAVHYRGANFHQARSACTRIARVARQYAAQFKPHEGKKVLEFLPAESNGKGPAVRALVARLRQRRRFPVVVYCGDDSTDESVFAGLSKNDFGIFVGRLRPSRARFYLRSPGEVCKFLERLCKIVV
jgi:trehalose-phosphatase